jgi:hypothetical protein
MVKRDDLELSLGPASWRDDNAHTAGKKRILKKRYSNVSCGISSNTEPTTTYRGALAFDHAAQAAHQITAV